MRYIRLAFILVLGIVLLVLAVANRQLVTLQALPEELAEFAGVAPQITLPLFLIIFGGIIAGLLIGFVWEWLREGKHRAEAAKNRRARERLEREVDQLKGPEPGKGADILAILDEGAVAR